MYAETAVTLCPLQEVAKAQEEDEDEDEDEEEDDDAPDEPPPPPVSMSRPEVHAAQSDTSWQAMTTCAEQPVRTPWRQKGKYKEKTWKNMNKHEQTWTNMKK